MYCNKIRAYLIVIIALIILLTSQTFSSSTVFHAPPVYAEYHRPIGSTAEHSVIHSIWHIQNYPILFIGDSRTVGMHEALAYSGANMDNHVFLAKIGKGYRWMQQINHEIETISSTPHIIVINLGVNDLGNLKKYEELYSIYHATIWKDCPIYIVSVNPVHSPCTSVSNSSIETFNLHMQEFIQTENASASAKAIPIQYIDTYSYLQEQGYQSKDGLHYSNSTYLRIYDYILHAIRQPIGDGEGWYLTHSSPFPAGTSDPRFSE